MRTKKSKTPWLETRRERHRYVLATAIFFLALTVVFGWPLLFGGRTLSGGDIVNQYLPYKAEIKNQILSGQFPHWNALTFSGRPLQADIQVGVFYPPNLLAWVLPLYWAFDLTTLLHFWIGGWGMALWMRRRVARTSVAWLSGALFMFGGYVTTRLMPGIVVFVAALAWMPWLFLCWDRLLESFRGLHGRRRSSAAGVLVLVAALEMLAGAPQIAFYVFAALGLYALILAWRMPAEETSEDEASPNSWLEAIRNWLDSTLPFRVAQLAALAGVVALAAGVCSVQLLPSSMMIGQSWDRATGATWDYVADGSLEPRMLLTLVVPRFFGEPRDEERYWGSTVGYWESNAYAGALPLLLLAIFLVGRWTLLRRIWLVDLIGPRRRDAIRFEIFLLVLIALALLFSFGKFSPFFWLAYHLVPGFDRFRVPGRLLLFYAFATAALSGWVLDRLLGLADEKGGVARLRRAASLRIVGGVVIVGVALCVMMLRITVPLMHLLKMPFYPFEGQPGDPRAAVVPYLESLARNASWYLLAQWIVVSLLVWGALAARKRLRMNLVGALAFVCIAELVHFGHGFMVTEPRAGLYATEYPRTERVEFLSKELKNGGRFLWFDSLLSYEVDQFQTELLTNRPIAFNLPELRGYDPVNSRRYGLYMNAITRQPITRNPRAFMFVPDLPADAVDWRLLALLDCRVALTYGEFKGADVAEATNWSFRVDSGQERVLRAYRLTNSAGPAWLVTDPLPVEPGTALEEIAGVLRNPKFDARTRAMVEGDPFALLPTDGQKQAVGDSSHDSVAVLARKAGRLSLRVSAAKQSVLVASQSFYPGWQARIDGQPAPVFPANLALCGVGVPPGEHTVELFYRPRQFQQGLVISMASLLLVLLLFVRRRPGY